MPILVKTHESATNAYFRLEFDETKIKLWTEDSDAMTTRTNSYIPNGNLIQAYHNYSYSDLFSEGAERTFYVQALESGEHDVEVTYLLDGHELDSKNVSFTAVELQIMCNDEVLDSKTVNVGEKISLEAVIVPDYNGLSLRFLVNDVSMSFN